MGTWGLVLSSGLPLPKMAGGSSPWDRQAGGGWEGGVGMKDPHWAHDVGFGRPEPPALATCVPTERRKWARREMKQRHRGGRSGTVAGDAAGLAPLRRRTSCICETSYLLLTSEQATSPDLPVNGGSEMGTESWLGPVEPVFQTSGAHRSEPPSHSLSPDGLLIPRLPPQGCALSSRFCRTYPRDVCAPGLRGAVARASTAATLSAA